MIYPDKVYIPVVRGCSVWRVVEIDTAKAKKTPSYIIPGYIQYNGGLYSACNVFLSAADAWDWIYLFRGYCGEIYTAAEIGSIQEVNAK